MGNRRSRFSSRFSSSDSDSDRSRRGGIWDDFDDSDDSDRSRQRSPSPPPKKPKLELKYNEEDSDDEDSQIEKANYTSQNNSINIKYCDWRINGFSYSDLFNEKGFVRSKVYRAGDYNEFQFYFVMEKLVTDDKTHFGVYVCVLSNIRSEATVSYKSYVVELRGHKYSLNSSRFQKFPRKPGFRFLGSLSEDRLLDDYWSYRFVPEDDLTLVFKINVYFKTPSSNIELEKLLEDNKARDITLVVKEKEFPANRTILKERSPTFAKLLSKDKKASKLEIKDVDPDIMKQILLFIYTGYVTKLFTYAKELSAAADKFKLKDLKVMCKKVS